MAAGTIHVPWWVFGSLAAAATIGFVLLATRPEARREDVAPGDRADNFVAQVTGSKAARWGGGRRGCGPARHCAGASDSS
ncbi:MAG: hypothetical protein HY736_05785 [Verrucomicrobia bacterium]|nr:hypothetical protein [Verrucomicrobiota bacterium]